MSMSSFAAFCCLFCPAAFNGSGTPACLPIAVAQLSWLAAGSYSTLPPAVKLPDAALDYRDRYQQLTGKSLRDCPKCVQGHMICIETFLPGTLPRGPPGACS